MGFSIRGEPWVSINMAEHTKYTGNFKFPDPPSEADILKCTHCGLCLNQCPT